MALLLVRHGRSLSKDIDPDQGLSEAGILEVEQIANAVKHHGIRVSRIDHSGKKRAQQTADIFASALNPKNGVQKRSGLKPLDDVTSLANQINSKDNLMLVGHLPFMAKLTSYLITGSTDTPIFNFQNSAILCMDQDADARSWFIKWALIPHIE
jgi:phosphohistidine phosphatase